MKVVEGRTFRELADRIGTSIANTEFSRCTFRHCLLSGEEVTKRPRIWNVSINTCEEFNCRISEAVIEDVTVDGLRTNDLFIVSDCAFKHVVLKGKFGALKITTGFAGLVKQRPTFQKALDEANSAYYANVDWALDISQAEFAEFDISGLALSLIRRDNETQIILPATVTLGGAWRDVPQFNKVWGYRIDALLKVGEGPELLLVAAKRNRDFKVELDALNALRCAGLLPA